jgi:hypothetical protein
MALNFSWVVEERVPVKMVTMDVLISVPRNIFLHRKDFVKMPNWSASAALVAKSGHVT